MNKNYIKRIRQHLPKVNLFKILAFYLRKITFMTLFSKAGLFFGALMVGIFGLYIGGLIIVLISSLNLPVITLMGITLGLLIGVELLILLGAGIGIGIGWIIEKYII
jgi:hypothetical protein